MLRLRGGNFYLILRRSAVGNSHSLAICPRFDTAISSWLPGQRISPIYALEDAKPPSLGEAQSAWVLFWGPCAPSRIISLPTPHCFLGLGLFNLIFFSTTQAQREAAKKVAEEFLAPWEEWALDGSLISDVLLSSRSSFPRKSRHVSRLHFNGAVASRAVKEVAREYLAVAASVLGNAERYDDLLLPDLERFDRQFRRAIQHPELETPEIRKSFSLANAALTRHASLTLTGTSPILESECHYWTHSLLGIGTASLALVRVRQFLENAFSRARIKDRILCLASEPPVERLESLRAGDGFWDNDHLFWYPSQKKHVPGPEVPPEANSIPLIMCFSSRDGFRSTAVSLSVPLEVLSACNVIHWTLMTLTHEFSHIIVESLLGKLLPNPQDSEELRRFADLLRPSSKFPDLLTQLRAFLCFALWQFAGKDEEEVEAEELRRYIIDLSLSLNETLTHCIDFQYFYRSDKRSYIQAVWASWSTIPNLHGNIYDYLIRCLCALHTQNLSRAGGKEETFKQLLANLTAARETLGDIPYLKEAITYLKKDKAFFISSLAQREFAVKFARFFLYSKTIEKLLLHEESLTSGGHDGYSFGPLQFSEDPIESPLRFLNVFTRDKAADPARSLWMLTQLAFHLGMK